MGKRLFQTLDEMNLEDIEKGSELVRVSGSMVSTFLTRKGLEVTMGVEESNLNNILSGKVVAILLLVDSDEYNKRKEG